MINSRLPTFVLVHGQQDDIVPPEQSHKFYEAFQEALPKVGRAKCILKARKLFQKGCRVAPRFAHAINTCLKEFTYTFNDMYLFQTRGTATAETCGLGQLIHEKLFVKEVPGEAHFEHLRTDSKLWSAAVDSLMTYL